MAAITSGDGDVDFEEISLAKKISKRKKINLIYLSSFGLFENYSEIFKAINFSLNENGILILEDPSLLECLKNCAYDQFYCEHIYVSSTISLQKILNEFSLEIFDIESTKTHGGSNRYFIKKKMNKIYKINKNGSNINKEKNFGLHKFSTYKKFAKNFKIKNNLIKIFKNIKRKNKNIIGYGATAKSCTVLNYCGL